MEEPGTNVHIVRALSIYIYRWIDKYRYPPTEEMGGALEGLRSGAFCSCQHLCRENPCRYWPLCEGVEVEETGEEEAVAEAPCSHCLAAHAMLTGVCHTPDAAHSWVSRRAVYGRGV